jgi:cardiolipin synthase C
LTEQISLASKKKHICIHVKSFVVDDKIAWIRYFNLYPRSIHLNTEAGLLVWDNTFANSIKENILIDINLQNSWTLAPREDQPLISKFSRPRHIIDIIPLAGLWPYRHIIVFELKEGNDPVPF